MRHSRLFTVCLLSFFGSLRVSAQEDSTYLRKYPDKLVVNPFFAARNFPIVLTPVESGKMVQDSSSITFYSNSRYVIGLSLSYKALSASYGVNLPPSFRSSKRKDNYQNLVLGYEKNRWLCEAVYRNYQGFTDIGYNIYTLEQVGLRPKLVRTDMHVRQLKGNVKYFHSADKFQYGGIFRYQGVPLRSALTFAASFSANQLVVDADSAVVPVRFRARYTDFHSVNRLQSVGVALLPGFAGVAVKENVFAGVIFLAGVAAQRQRFEPAAITAAPTRVVLASDISLIVGYNSPRLFFGLTLGTDSNMITSRSMHLQTYMYALDLNVGWRLTAPRLLAKLY